MIKAGREPYRGEMQEAIEATSAAFKKEAALLYEKLLAVQPGSRDEGGAGGTQLQPADPFSYVPIVRDWVGGPC